MAVPAPGGQGVNVNRIITAHLIQLLISLISLTQKFFASVSNEICGLGSEREQNNYCTFVKPPSLKGVKIKRFTILGIDLVSQTNKLKKHRIVGLFKTTTNKILDKINGKRRVHFEQISHRSRPSINRAKCCRLASRLTALSMISKRNLKQVTFKLELSYLLSVILLSSLSKLRIFSPPNKAA